MTKDLEKQYTDLLSTAAEDLDISPHKFMDAVRKYASVGKLISVQSPDSHGITQVYLQGSFSLGTVIRPFRKGKNADYDIDLVCQLPHEQDQTTPAHIKMIVGDILKNNATYKKILDTEGTRCWTLVYALDSDGFGFHMDILPCIAEIVSRPNNVGAASVYADTTIGITHKRGMGKNTVYVWLSSNPSGYKKWFTAINSFAFNRIAATNRKTIYENNRAVFDSVKDVPEQLVKTPLQQAIQISKRHRDVSFSGRSNEDEKPISMIITTLFASLYANEADTFTALKNILEKIKSYSALLSVAEHINVFTNGNNIIERSADGKWYVRNPVNKDENFADMWNFDSGTRAIAFFQWVEQAHNDLIEVIKLHNIEEITEAVNKSLAVKSRERKIAITLAEESASVTRQDDISITEIISPNKPWKDN